MKFYVKPTVEVVELSAKENMAALPAGVLTQEDVGGETMYLTTYNLAAVETSDVA